MVLIILEILLDTKLIYKWSMIIQFAVLINRLILAHFNTRLNYYSLIKVLKKSKSFLNHLTQVQISKRLFNGFYSNKLFKDLFQI